MEKPTPSMPWHAHSVGDVLASFHTTKYGLSAQEARERLQKEGLNALKVKPPKSAVRIFFDQFTNPLMGILVLAALVSAILLEWMDAGVIAFAALFNATLGFIEEYKADRSMRALQSILPQQARVRRREGDVFVDAKEIVTGDIVLLSSGDKITADGRIIFAQSFQADESSLTGESAPVEKTTQTLDSNIGLADQTNRLFAGTVAVAGHAIMVVTQTGSQTQIGAITSMLDGIAEIRTPLQDQLRQFARWIGIVILLATGALFVVGLFAGFEILEMMRIAVAVAVATIPEGLVVALTVTLAIGMQRILKRKALVRRLTAAETLGSVSVICMDKTGTITTGEMTLVHVCAGEGALYQSLDAHPQLARILWNTKDVFLEHTSGQERFSGSSTEVAILRAFEQSGMDTMALPHVVDEIPFDSARKYKARLYKGDRGLEIGVVGAPEILFEKLDLTDAQNRKYTQRLHELMRKGLRVLLVAHTAGSGTKLKSDDLRDLQFDGFIGLKDPVRKTAAHTIAKAREAGLVPIMITGDHPETAYYIAKEVGLIKHKNEIMTGSTLDELDDRAFQDMLTKISVYARVLPRHKLRIVQAWRTHGQSVAMVGDGVNDAPAVKGADIGIALGSGTEVAKEAADMVLLDNHFGTIISAIEEGRAIFDNIRKVIVYLLCSSFTEMILIFGAILFTLPLPILPAQILWINLVTDGFPSIALTFEKPEPGAMKEAPRKKNEPLLNTEMKALISVISLASVAILFGIYVYLLHKGFGIDHIRTFIFMGLGINSLFYVFAVRTFRKSVFTLNPFENKWLLGGVLVGAGFLLTPILVPTLRTLFTLTPLEPIEWLILIGFGFIQLLFIELIKMRYYKKFRTQRS